MQKQTPPRMFLDPLGLALFRHHKERAPPSLMNRLLPVPIYFSPTFRKVFKKKEQEAEPELIKKPLLANGVYDIMARVCMKHGVSQGQVLSSLRTTAIVRARHECCYRIVAESNFSYTQIGDLLGGRDHTTVMAAVLRHAIRNRLPHPRNPDWRREDFAERASRKNAASQRWWRTHAARVEPLPEITCKHCNKPMTPVRQGHSYCDEVCRTRARVGRVLILRREKRRVQKILRGREAEARSAAQAFGYTEAG